jgi:hypothetical protein
MMQVLIDTDTVLEFFLGRNNFISEVKDLQSFIDSSSSDLYMTQCGLKKIRVHIKYFFERKACRKINKILKESFKFISINKTIASEALSKPLHDIESAIEFACADKMRIGAIITHRPKDFAGASLPILTVKELKKRNLFEETLFLDDCLSIFSVENWEEVEYLERVFERETSRNNLENYLFAARSKNQEIQRLLQKFSWLHDLKIEFDKPLSLEKMTAQFLSSPEISAVSQAIHKQRIEIERPLSFPKMADQFRPPQMPEIGRAIHNLKHEIKIERPPAFEKMADQFRPPQMPEIAAVGRAIHSLKHEVKIERPPVFEKMADQFRPPQMPEIAAVGRAIHSLRHEIKIERPPVFEKMVDQFRPSQMPKIAAIGRTIHS